jgi:hypothetical protein
VHLYDLAPHTMAEYSARHRPGDLQRSWSGGRIKDRIGASKGSTFISAIPARGYCLDQAGVKAFDHEQTAEASTQCPNEPHGG